MMCYVDMCYVNSQYIATTHFTALLCIACTDTCTDYAGKKQSHRTLAYTYFFVRRAHTAPCFDRRTPGTNDAVSRVHKVLRHRIPYTNSS